MSVKKHIIITIYIKIMLSETVELDWKNYNITTNNAFRKLYNDKMLTDVTLACEENKKI